ncbi:cytochrome aa3 quinol oxidase subunit II [Effusibacillus consociatus]|uniref:Quinol oxidase subunit 2 n=1 Tax=Effusibacillus consociatus TaxID=1117041 RepID=A0ABV9Q1J6_9BACL
MKKWLISLLAMSSALLSGCQTNMVVFEPQGPVARSIMELINWSLLWMLLVVVVVLTLFGYIVWKYREKKENMNYEPPEEHGSTTLEIIWTAIPILIVTALTVPTVKTLYALENVPAGYESKKPITIHVTSADWKWIFSYPEQGIETVNYVNIPEDTPIDFKLTSAGTMQSFWIPALGGQKYAMNKMETQLYLVADNPGSYFGRNTNFNGKGYAEMEFEVQVKTEKDFDEWVSEAKSSAPKLTEQQYEELLKPTHLGRLTYSNTHLAWVDHSKPDSKSYTNPELYRGHGYPGKIFEEEDNYRSPDAQKDAVQNLENKDAHRGDTHGH